MSAGDYALLTLTNAGAAPCKRGMEPEIARTTRASVRRIEAIVMGSVT